jgi:AraC-like DNA-binding protein
LIQESALSLISTSTIPKISDQEGLRINTILQYVMQHYHRSIPLEEIAAVIHMVPGSFCRYFKQRTGKTFIRFLNEIRIQEACRRLALERESQIAAIAFPCGFKNVSTFNRVFRQIKSQSPSEYLASLRKVL